MLYIVDDLFATNILSVDRNLNGDLNHNKHVHVQELTCTSNRIINMPLAREQIQHSIY